MDPGPRPGRKRRPGDIITGPTRDTHHALAVAGVPPAVSLFLALFALEALVTVVEERRRIRRRCDEITREAMSYRSPPEREMDDRLDATRLVLLQRGFVPRGLRGPLADRLDDQEQQEALRHSLDPARARHASAMAREVKRTLHPDTNEALLVLSEEEIAEAIARVKTAEELADPDLAYEVLIETLPKYHVGRARQRLAAGMSLVELASEEPSLAAELHWLRWLTLQPGRRVADLPYPNLSKAKTDAARMMKEADRLTLAHAFALAYAAAEDVRNYRRTKPTDADGLETLSNVVGHMAEVGHDLWTTEAQVEEALNASVLVKRLHAGVGREVRELGNAVYHVAKVLAPDEVYPESIASAAATLHRAVHWVNNALTQFKMELRAAERRLAERPPAPIAARSSSGSFSRARRY